MHAFTDGKNRKWTFEVNVLAVKRVKDQTGVDLLTLMDPESDAFEKLATDVVALSEVMTAILADQLDNAEITKEEFLRALNNELIIRSATRACMDAILSFSQTPKAEVMTTAFGKVWEATEKRERMQLEHAQKLVASEEFDRVIAQTAESVIPGRPSSA